VLQHAMDLRCGYSTERKVGKIIFCKECDLAGLSATAGLATDDFAMKEHFVDRMWMPRHVTMPTIIPDRGKLGGVHLEARFVFRLRILIPFGVQTFDADWGANSAPIQMNLRLSCSCFSSPKSPLEQKKFLNFA
jgi:hypothetical protein